MIQSYRHRSAASRHRQAARRRRQRFSHLSFERLEERYLLATIVWDGGPTGNGTDWNVAANWFNKTTLVNDVQPGSNDDVQIDTAFAGATITHAAANTTIRSLSSAANLQIVSGSFSIEATSAAPHSHIGNSLIKAGGTFSLNDASLDGPGQVTNQGTLNVFNSTVDATLSNASGGQIVVTGTTSAFTGSFSNPLGATLLIGTGAGDPVLTVADGFTNAGFLQLVAVSSNGSQVHVATLNVNGGTLVNTGTISSSGNTFFDEGFSNRLNAELDNQGTIALGARPLKIDKAGAHHSNSGSISITGNDLIVNQSGAGASFTNTSTIAIAAGRTLTLSGGIVNLNGGTIDSAGFLIVNSSTITLIPNLTIQPSSSITLNSTTITGGGKLTNQGTLNVFNSTVDVSLTNTTGGQIIATGTTSLFTGAFSNEFRASLAIGNGAANVDPGLTVASGFTNAGFLQLTAVSSNGSQVHVATLNVNGGTLVNTGTISSSGGPTIFDEGFSNRLNAELDNQGTIALGARPLKIDKAGAHHSNSGSINVTGNNLIVNQSGAGATFTNTGTIAIAIDKTFTATGGSFNFAAGALDNAGSLVVNSTTFHLTSDLMNPLGGIIELHNSVIIGSGRLTNQGTLNSIASSFAVALANESGGQITVQSSSAFSGGFSNAAGALLQVVGNASGSGNAALTVSTGFINAGTIQVLGVGSHGSVVARGSLNVTTGTLVNTGVIDSGGDDGDEPNQLNADVDNQGTLSVSARPLGMFKTGLQLHNSGTISIASNKSLRVAAGGSFTNLSAGVLTGGTYLIAGSFEFPNAAITTNAATIVLDGGGARIANESNSNSNALRTLTSNLAGASLTLRNFAAITTQTNLTNAGDITIGASSTVTTGSYTQTATGSFGVEIGGPPTGLQFGRLLVSGHSILDGAIHISLLNGFGPQQGQSFPVLSSAFGQTGDFSSRSGLNIGHVKVFDVATGGGSVLVIAVADAGDLAAEANSIAVQPNATSGDAVPVTYTIRNTSATPVPGDWFDSLYLSSDSILDATDTLIGRIAHTGGLDGLASYTTTATLPLPGTVEGDYRVIVVADSRGLVPDKGRSNNTAVSNSVIRTRLPILTLGQTTSVTLDGGEQRFFRLDVPVGNGVQLGVNFSQPGTNGAGYVFELFGQIPAPGRFDRSASSANGLHQNLFLLGAAGPHYVLILNSDPPGHVQTFDLTPAPLPFSATSIGPNHGSHLGEVTMTIAGAGFTQTDGAVLQNSTGANRPAKRVLFKDGNTLFATFNLAGLDVGSYDLMVTRGNVAATNALVFQVTNGIPGHVSFQVASPKKIKVGTVGKVTVDYFNDGDTDVSAPLVRLNAGAALVAPFIIPTVTYSSSGGGGGGGGGGANSGSVFPGPLKVADLNKGEVNLQFLAISQAGLGGVLSPGARGHVELEFRAPDQPAPPDLFFTALIDKEPATKNPKFMKEDLRPPTVSPEAWDVLFAKFLARVGSSDLSYQIALDDAATYLSQIGQSTSNVAQLTAFLVEQEDNAYPGGILAEGIDAAAPAAGLPLTLARVYSQPISRRYELGAFGRGWSHSYEMTLQHIFGATVDDDLVIIHGPGGDRAFKKNPPDPRFPDRVVFGGQFGDPGKIEGAGLTEPDGTVYSFDDTGRLLDIQDSNFNRVRLNYTDGRLTSAVHSNGDAFAFAYNPQGRVSQVTDQAGRVTTYTYDAAGEHLLQVTGPQGIVAYTYDTGHGAASEHALTSVANFDGSHDFYSYDSEGRLIHSERDGGAEAVSLAYGPQATVAFTDDGGAKGTVFFDPFGHAAQVRDALGQIVTRTYDSSFHLDREHLPGNLTIDTDFRENGYLDRRVDPSGHEVRTPFVPTQVGFGFSTNTRLVEITDELGVRTDFNYDPHGNLTSIKYPQGPSPQFVHDAVGNLSAFVNRRGQAITYTHNARGQLTRKSHADGSHEEYTYDNRGNLLSASDEHGTTTFKYDAGDRLTRVTYPNGRFLIYTRDSGGRITRMDAQDGFAVRYTYDAVGRLSSVRDAAGAVLTGYTYDVVGRLIRQDHANGTFTTYDHDAAGQVTHLVNVAPGNAVNSRFDYAYDVLGRRTQMTTLDGAWTYEYDALGQLTHAVFGSTNAGIPNQDLQYEYDPAGNRIRTTQNGVTVPYTTNKLDQYTLVGAATHSYDADGHLIAVGSGATGTSETFDDEGRLIGVTTPAGAWSYEYDALGRRVASVHNGQRTEYLLDPTGLVDVVGEYAGTGSALAHYAYGLGLAGRVGADGTTDFYDFDGTGSTAGLTGTGGSYVNAYSYLPFGESLAPPQETVANPFAYVGQFGVMQESNGLNFMRARYYSPTDGRFISADPIGIAGGINLYRYTANNPVDAIDPSGLVIDPITGLDFDLIYAEIAATVEAAAEEGLNELMVDSAQKVAQDADANSVRAEFAAAAALQRAATQIIRLRSPSLLAALRQLIAPAAEIAAATAITAFIVAPNKFINALNAGVGVALPYYFPGLVPYFQHLACRALDCDQPDPAAGSPTTPVRSLDPNDITGPGGFGDQGFLTPDFALPYTIHFENIASATAPAQTVVVTQQLDADLDFRTFELGNISFGAFEFAVSPGLQSFSARFDVRDQLGIFLDISADFNPLTGLATWTFTSVDPTTFDLPVDPDLGFLPPNKVAPNGEGFVSYTIRSKASLTTGTRLDAKGKVIFDTNASLDTPAIFNTIDAGAPTSSVVSLFSQSSPQFAVNWSGRDETGGSGIASYSVFVSDNNGPVIAFVKASTVTTATFTGTVGHVYRFFSVATDNVGHVEKTPAATFDTQTLVVAAPWQNSLFPTDVDNDASMSPLDVLVIVNELNSPQYHTQQDARLVQRTDGNLPFFDVDGDGFVSPLDALIIINAINRGSSSGEGEANSSQIHQDLFADTVWLDEWLGKRSDGAANPVRSRVRHRLTT